MPINWATKATYDTMLRRRHNVNTGHLAFVSILALLVTTGCPLFEGAVVAPGFDVRDVLQSGLVPDDRRILSASLNRFGQVASVSRDGVVGVSDSVDRFDAESALGAVGVAWSNAGDQLAVITRDLSDPSAPHRLLVLPGSLQADPALDLPIQLPLPDDFAPYDWFVVSWNADDSSIAVSTDAKPYMAIRTGDSDNDEVFPICHIVSVLDGAVETHELHNAYFVGQDLLAATLPTGAERTATESAGFRVHLLRRSGGVLEDRGQIGGAGFCLASVPPSGVFATADERLPGSPLLLSTIRLRTIEGGTRSVGNQDPNLPALMGACDLFHSGPSCLVFPYPFFP